MRARMGSFIISSSFSAVAVAEKRTLLLPVGVAVNSITARGARRACVVRAVGEVTRWPSSTIIRGRCRCSRLAKDHFGRPAVSMLLPAASSSDTVSKPSVSTPPKCGSIASLCA